MLSRTTLAVLTLFACAGFVSCSGPQSEPAPEPTAMAAAAPAPWNPVQVKERLDAGEDLFLLDVREPRELEETGALAGYVNIPIDQLEGRLAEVPKDRPIVTYCMRGGRASRAADLLREKGYTKPIEFGGIMDWKDQGLAVVQPEAPVETQ